MDNRYFKSWPAEQVYRPVDWSLYTDEDLHYMSEYAAQNNKHRALREISNEIIKRIPYSKEWQWLEKEIDWDVPNDCPF